MNFLDDGQGLSMRPVERADLPRLRDWRNQPDIRLRTREWRPLTLEHQERWFARITAPDAIDFMFAVEPPETEMPSPQLGGVSKAIGVVGWTHWSPIDQVAETSFYIGPAEARGKGYAHRALVLLHEWGFQGLGLARAFAEVYADNAASIALLIRLGYREEGRLRSHVFRGGRRQDSLLLGLLREEWKAP